MNERRIHYHRRLGLRLIIRIIQTILVTTRASAVRHGDDDDEDDGRFDGRFYSALASTASVVQCVENSNTYNYSVQVKSACTVLVQ